MSVFVTGGGTGGHFFPARALAIELHSRGIQTVYLGASDGIEAKLDVDTPYTVEITPGLKRHSLIQKCTLVPKLVLCFILLAKLFVLKRPQAVVATGGYVSLIPCMLAQLLGIPLYLLEQNRIAGRVVAQFSAYATYVGYALPLVQRGSNIPSHESLVGNPASSELVQKAAQKNPVEKLKNILVMGGSASADAIDKAMVQATATGVLDGLSIVHIARPENKEELHQSYRQGGVDAEVLGFCSDMPQQYLKADLVICRAGASSITELALFGLPALYVPYIYAVDNHQFHNASYVVEQGGGVLCEQGPDFAKRLSTHLQVLRAEPQTLQALAKGITTLARPRATQDVVNRIVDDIDA